MTGPEGSGNTVTLSYNGLTATSSSFTYSAVITPTINSIEPSTSSPVIKSVIKINGVNFGSDKSNLQAFLKDANETNVIYELSILNCTDSTIFAILGGGRTNNYTVSVLIKKVAYSIAANATAAKFKYQIIINSFSPKVGSLVGGT